MTCRVLYTDTFRSDISSHVAYLRQNLVSEETIERWYDRLFSQLDDLSMWPKKWPVDVLLTADLGRETRKLVYARFVITYYVDEAQHHVILLRMIHGARRR